MFPGDSEQIEELSTQHFPARQAELGKLGECSANGLVMKGESKLTAVRLIWLGMERRYDLANIQMGYFLR